MSIIKVGTLGMEILPLIIDKIDFCEIAHDTVHSVAVPAEECSWSEGRLKD